MAVQVAQPADVSATAAATTTTTPGAFKDEMLSPVSKLQAAREQAAREQQKRVEAAVTRVASTKAENAGKRKLLEEKLDAHAKVKVQKTAAASKRTVVVEKSTSETTTTVAHTKQQQQQEHIVAASVQENKTVVAQQSETTTTVSASYDATHELLRATRNKLKDLASEEEVTAAVAATQQQQDEGEMAEENWEGPSTNYHLKQLGLVKKKIDIYAPVEQQQQEIRRLRDRSRFSPQASVDAEEEDHDSENDSDFTPGVESEEDSDAESIPEVEAEETLELVKETVEHEKKVRQKQLLAKISLFVLFFCVVVVALLAAVEISQQQFEFCAPDTDQSVCASFLQARAAVKTVVADAAESVRASTAGLRARFHYEF